MQRLIVIGLDGATWKLIAPWADQGLLPNFARIRQDGAFGILKSTNPPLTSPGWPAFFTGKNPGKHGVYDFIEPQGDRVSNGSLVRTQSLWEILSAAGKACIVQNVPLTFPPRQINGVMVTDMMAAPGEIFTHPAELTATLNDRGYKIDILFDRPKEKPKAEVVATINRIEEQHMELFRELLQTKPWDFAMLAITGMDRLQHYYWDDQTMLREHYQLIDRLLGELLETYSAEADFVFLSDHGFCTKTTQVDLNLWLEQAGYLAWRKAGEQPAGESWMDKTYYKTRSSPLKRGLKRLGLTHETIQRSPLLKATAKRLPKPLRKKLGKQLEQAGRTQDWAKTRAFIPTGIVRGLNINLQGRQAHGSVAPEDYEALRQELITKLSDLKTPAGKPVFAKVAKREEVYHGPFVDEAYDILFELADDSILPVAKKNRQLFSPSDHAGYHDEDGIFALLGPDFLAGEKPAAKLEDLAPTILHRYGVAIPRDMDGQVLLHCLREPTNPVYSERTEKADISAALRSISL